eukprot:349676-Chlamydomonas_euryale.AAC.9
MGSTISWLQLIGCRATVFKHTCLRRPARACTAHAIRENLQALARPLVGVGASQPAPVALLRHSVPTLSWCAAACLLGAGAQQPAHSELVRHSPPPRSWCVPACPLGAGAQQPAPSELVRHSLLSQAELGQTRVRRARQGDEC